MPPKFIRFGGLSLLRYQKEYEANSADVSFYRPPVRRGIFAFPLKAVERFLLWGESGPRTFAVRIRQGRTFTHTGNIWHHLGEHCPPNEVMVRHGNWVKTTVAAWERAYRKQSLQDRFSWPGPPHQPVRNINEPWYAGVAGYCSRDHYEVFFDEKVG